MITPSEEHDVLCKEILSALRGWKSTSTATYQKLTRLLIFREMKRTRSEATTLSLSQELIQSAWSELEQTHPKQSELLKQRFIERITSLELSLLNHLSEDQIKKSQKKAIQQLTDILLQREYKRRESFLEEIGSEFDFKNYHQLFGSSSVLSRIEQHLLSTDSPPIIGLTGIGGIGKTSYANEVMRRVAHKFHFDSMAWVSFNQTRIEPENFSNKLIKHLSQKLLVGQGVQNDLVETKKELSRFFNQNTCLIIIDNLELPEEVAHIITLIRSWGEQSKFLLTARSWSPEFEHSLQIQLDELSQDDALFLFREQAKLKGLKNAKRLTSEQFSTLYELIGGNPLMIKLTVSLVQTLPLNEVISDLMKGITEKTEWRYRYIYSKLWASLTVEAQQLMEAMPLVGRTGGAIPQLVAMSRLSHKETLNSIGLLTNRNLLEVRGSTSEKRYGIHRLTQTFIETDIISLPNAFIMDRDKYYE